MPMNITAMRAPKISPTDTATMARTAATTIDTISGTLVRRPLVAISTDATNT